MSFSSLGLHQDILRAVAEQGYNTPTPIQAKAIPAVLEKKDVLAAAQTGTGKTASFTLPLLQLLAKEPSKASGQHRPIRALILSPTRELAAQIEENVRAYGQYLPLKSLCIFGGVNIQTQIRQLRQGVDILVATPGRLLDHVAQKTIQLSSIDILVLDEADRMLDMGFIHDIKRILQLLPEKRQNLLFSATFSKEIKEFAKKLLNQPSIIEVTPSNSTVDVIEQTVYPVARSKKAELLAHLMRQQQWSQVLVFTRTKHGANKLVEELAKHDISSMAIHGNKSQAARTRALQSFKDKEIQALIATDIAARGIDIDQLPFVVNYDLPNVPADYVHRIGRTGRAGAAGKAVSLVSVDENILLRDIEKFTHQTIPVETLEEFVPLSSEKPQPIQLRSKEFAQKNTPRTSAKRQPQQKPSQNGQAHKPRTPRAPRSR